jgi:hypothetical protein
MQGTKAAVEYTSTVDCFKKIISQEGFGAFYAGIVPRLGRVVPGQGTSMERIVIVSRKKKRLSSNSCLLACLFACSPTSCSSLFSLVRVQELYS